MARVSSWLRVMVLSRMLYPVPVGGLVDVLDELGMEGVTDVHDHADEPTTATGQRTGRPIRAITQASGGGDDALTGRRARPGDVAQARVRPSPLRHRRRPRRHPAADVALILPTAKESPTLS